MQSDSAFHKIADATLEAMADEVETQDEELLIDVDLTGGILTLELDSGQQYVISKHAPSHQLWLSSPISGGLHYDYNSASESWELAKDGSRLDERLSKELYQLTSIVFDFISE